MNMIKVSLALQAKFLEDLWYVLYIPDLTSLYVMLSIYSHPLLQAADVIVFLMDANTMPGPFGDKCLSCVVAQGIPSCFHIVQVF